MDSGNKKEAVRKKSPGELGELFAIKALADKKFDRIRNLNDNHKKDMTAGFSKSTEKRKIQL